MVSSRVDKYAVDLIILKRKLNIYISFGANSTTFRDVIYTISNKSLSFRSNCKYTVCFSHLDNLIFCLNVLLCELYRGH